MFVSFFGEFLKLINVGEMLDKYVQQYLDKFMLIQLSFVTSFFCAHVRICSLGYTEEESNSDSKAVCVKLAQFFDDLLLN